MVQALPSSVKVGDRVIVLARPYEEWLRAQKLPKDSTDRDDFNWMEEVFTVKQIKNDRVVLKGESLKARTVPIDCIVKYETSEADRLIASTDAVIPYSVDDVVLAMGCEMRITAVYTIGDSFEYECFPVRSNEWYWRCDRWLHSFLEPIKDA